MTNLSSIAGFSSGGGGGGGSGSGGGIPALCGETPTSSVQVPIHASSGTNRTHTSGNSGWIEGQCTNGVLKSRNTYGHWVHYHDNTAGAFRQGTAMTPITVNRSTGAITVGTPQDVWVNTNVSTGGVSYGTTLNYEPVHGCFVNSGLAGWDTSSATEYSYGHAYGQLQANGTVSLQASVTNNASATMSVSGSYCISLPQGTGTQHTIMPSNYSYGWFYTMEATSTGWQNVGSTTFPHTGTYSYPANHCYQPDISTVDTALPACVINCMHTASEYGYYVNHNGSTYDVDPPNQPIYSSKPDIFLRDNKPILFCIASASTFTAAGGGGFTLTEHETLMNGDMIAPWRAINKCIGLGANRYLICGERSTRKVDFGEAVILGVKADYNVENLGKLSIPKPYDDILEKAEDQIVDFFTVYENDTDANPKWLLRLKTTHGGTGLQDITAESYEITADLTAYATST